MTNQHLRKGFSLLFLSLFSTSLAHAQVFDYIRIGDVDGFGFEQGINPSTGDYFKAANGLDVNQNALTTLGTGDYLPDLNTDGVVAWSDDDEFDNRYNESVFSSGVRSTNNFSTGQEYTDLSLSRGFNDFPVYNYMTNSEGSGGLFPGDGNPDTLSDNQPGFIFDFEIDSTDVFDTNALYFNMVFGDYDVVGDGIQLTYLNGNSDVLSITTQPASQDGLIKSAFVEITNTFQVFTPLMGSPGFRGYLEVDFLASSEPYTAFDFVELSTVAIDLDPEIPEPSTVGLLGMALIGGYLYVRRRRNAA